MAGFTLLEVLVSVLVLAIGMLGIAALLVQGMKYNHDAYLRSQVSSLAYDITDRIRLNRVNAAAYISNYNTQAPALAGNSPCDYTLAPAAQNDLNCWWNQTDVALPPGSTAQITAAGAVYTIALLWTDRDNQPHDIKYAFQP